MAVAIEFRCKTCGKLLRTGPENAGRPAACPGCGDRVEVPQDVVEVGDRQLPAVEAAPVPRHPPQPHRGGIVLAFGILSWASFCFPFGVAAWALGVQDLKAMRHGEMDPTGEGLTRAGMILGAINVVLSGLAVLVMVGVASLAAVLR